jgi:protein tyrosine phosphatase (PTP) superfamily phosphohydrolase (DUF442 family)
MAKDEEDGEISRITDLLAIGGRDGSGGPSLETLCKLGFVHVIDLNADPTEQSRASGLSIMYHPVRVTDETSTEGWLEQVRRAVDIVSEAETRGEPVFIHCTYGVGRSPTFAMAWLVHRGHPVEHAVETVMRSRPGTWREGNPTEKYRAILDSYARSG